jgi:hypothetical protein
MRNDEAVAERLRCSVLDLDDVDTILYMHTLAAVSVENEVERNPHRQVVETVN